MKTLYTKNYKTFVQKVKSFQIFALTQPCPHHCWDVKTSERLARQSGSLALNWQAVIAVI